MSRTTVLNAVLLIPAIIGFIICDERPGYLGAGIPEAEVNTLGRANGVGQKQCATVQAKTRDEFFPALLNFDISETNDKVHMQFFFTGPTDILGWTMRGKSGKIAHDSIEKRRGIVTEYTATFLSSHGVWTPLINEVSNSKEFVNSGNLAMPEAETKVSLSTPLSTLALRIYPQMWDGVPFIHINLLYCLQTLPVLASPAPSTKQKHLKQFTPDNITISSGDTSADEKVEPLNDVDDTENLDILWDDIDVTTSKPQNDTDGDAETQPAMHVKKMFGIGNDITRKVFNSTIKPGNNTVIEAESRGTKGTYDINSGLYTPTATPGSPQNETQTVQGERQGVFDRLNTVTINPETTEKSKTGQMLNGKATEVKENFVKENSSTDSNEKVDVATETSLSELDRTGNGINSDLRTTPLESFGASTVKPADTSLTGLLGSTHVLAKSQESISSQPTQDMEEEQTNCSQTRQWRYSNVSDFLNNDRFSSPGSTVPPWSVIYALNVIPFRFTTENENQIPYLQVDFEQPCVIESIKVKGYRDGSSWGGLSRFTLMYKYDQENWLSYMEDDSAGEAQVFRCDVDSVYKANIAATFSLHRPITADALMIIPTNWIGQPYMKLDLLTCIPSVNEVRTACNSSLLTADGRLLPVTFQNLDSPTLDRNLHFKTVRLSTTSLKRVTAIVLKTNGSDVITEFSLRYASENGKWNDVHDGQGEAKVFRIPNMEPISNSTEPITFPIIEPFDTSVLHLYLRSWSGRNPGIWLNMLGCAV